MAPVSGLKLVFCKTNVRFLLSGVGSGESGLVND